MKNYNAQPKTMERFTKVQELIKQGKTHTEACAEAGMGRALYYTVRRKMEIPDNRPGKKVKPRKQKESSLYQTIPMGRANDFELRGSPESIARFVKELSRKGDNE